MSATTGRLALTVAGGVIGSFFGAPGLGLALGGIAGSLLFPGPDPPPTLGPRLGDQQVQTSSYGSPIPSIFGTDRVAGNVIWNSDIREIARKQKSGGGGKGGAPQQESVTFEYRVDLAIGLHDGPILGIKRVWANDQLFYDFSDPPHARGIGATLYLGSETQNPDPTIEADKGSGNTPAHRGLAYIMLKDLSLTPFNNAVPTFHFEVIANGNPVVPVTEVLDDPVNGGPGRVAIDPDTGLIWATRRLINQIVVLSCENGLNVVCRINDGPKSPQFLSYSPAFTAVNVDILGTVSIQNVKAKMWVGSRTPDADPEAYVAGYATDASCQELERFQDPFRGSNFCWPGMVHVDTSSIDTQGPNFGDGPSLLIGVTNGACFYISSFDISPFGSGGGLETIDPNLHNPAVLAQVEWTADMVQGNEGEFYGVDGDGRIWRGRTLGGGGVWGIDLVVLGAASFANEENSITWDPDEEMLYSKIRVFPSGPNKVAKWTRDLVKVWEFDTNVASDSFFDAARVRYHTGVGDVWLAGSSLGTLITKKIDKVNGGFAQEFSTTSTRHIHDFQPFPGAPFAVGTIFGTPGGVIKFPLGPGALPQAPTLASVVQALVEKSGTLTAADIDVSDLTSDTVRGYTISQRMPIRAAIQPLMLAYFFDAVESDYQIKFIKRGNASSVTIPPEDLAARREPSAPGDPVVTDRTQENELPNQLDVRFKNADVDYKIGVTSTRRLIGDSQQLRTVDLPIVFSPDEAKAINDVLLHNAWFERLKKTIQLSRKYLRTDPTDVITITDPDQGQITIRVNQISTSLPGLLQLSCAEEDVSVYTGFAFPAPVGLQPQPGILDTPPVVLVIMDTATLQDADNNTGVYVVAYAIGGPYRYAEVLFSTNNIGFGAAAALPNEGAVGYAQGRLTWDGSFN